MTLATSKSLARWIGFLVGLALAVWLVLLGRMPAHSGAPAAQVSMTTKPTQKLLVEPAGTKFLSATRLKPGPAARGARGSFEVMNLTRRRMSVTLAARPSTRDLDALLRVRISAEGKQIFQGSLQRLRSWSAGFELGRGQTKRLAVRAWLPPSVGTRYQGRAADVKLKWRTRAASS